MYLRKKEKPIKEWPGLCLTNIEWMTGGRWALVEQHHRMIHFFLSHIILSGRNLVRDMIQHKL